MSERGERFDSAPEPAQVEPPKQLSPTGMSAMRGEAGDEAPASAPPAAPPEIRSEQPASAGGGAVREPTPVPDPAPAAVADRSRFDQPQPAVDRERYDPPQPPAADRDRQDQLSYSPEAPTPAEPPQRRNEQPGLDPSRPDPVAYPHEQPAVPPEPFYPREPQPSPKTPENIPESLPEKPIPHTPSDVASGPRKDYALPDGSPTKITGDLNRFKDLNHEQGEGSDVKSTCGICAAQCVANEHGIPVNEADVLKKAADHQPPLCDMNPNLKPELRGGTTPETRAELLTGLGVPSHVETGKNFDDLSKYIDDGKSVVLSTNAGHLWDDPNYAGQDPTKPNHAVTLIDVAHDPKSDAVQGFYINDSGNYDNGGGSGRFVDLKTMQNAWLNTGGKVVVSDKSHR